MARRAGGIALCCMLFGFVFISTVQAQLTVTPAQGVRSVSGQFVIEPRAAGWVPGIVPARMSPSEERKYVRLEPALLSVSCERIKAALYRQLDATADAWQGRIYVALYPSAGGEDPTTVTSVHFLDGWQYRVELPDYLDRDRYVQALVQALLVELANRSAGDRPAEVPLWLTEGLTRRLLTSPELQIILPPPARSVNGLRLTTAMVDMRKTNAVEEARHELAARPPLTFDELSWPADDELSGDKAKAYRDSAQLFVAELLRLRDGAACLRAMLAELPQHYNWQIAFLTAFGAHFTRLVDVETWWAVQSTEFSASDFYRSWTLAESWEKLDRVLLVSSEIRTGTNELPTHADVRLQKVLREWEGARLTDALEAKARELRMLRTGIARQLSGLVLGYRAVLESYLQKRHQAGASGVADLQHAAEQRATSQAILDLDLLDAQRETLRSSLKTLLAPSDHAVTVRIH